MAPSRGIWHALSKAVLQTPFCRPCYCRTFATSSSKRSGHNRWSKIKHDKGKADAAINKQRSIFAHEIATASKIYGPEPNANPRLADLISKAKKAGFAKASIEAAIARGQGRSSTGASLESVTIEGLLPNNVAVIVDCETESKLRTLADVRLIIKDHGGSSTPTSYLFTRKGRVVYEDKEGIGIDDFLEPALEAGATDVQEGEDGRAVVYTEPGETKAVGEAICDALQVQIATSDIFWNPNEDTVVAIPDEAAVEELAKFVEDLRGRESSVQNIALNLTQGSLGDGAWQQLKSRIDV